MKLNECTQQFLLGPVFFPDQRGLMPLHDAVRINSDKGATTENQGTGVKYMG